MSCPSIGRGITNKLLPGRDSVTPINLPLAHGRPLPLVLWPRGDFMLSIQPGAPTSGPSGCVQRRREKVSQESPVPTAGREMVWPAGGAFSYQDPWLCSNKHPSPPTILCEKASRSSRDASQATGVTEGLKMPAVQLGLQGPRSCLQRLPCQQKPNAIATGILTGHTALLSGCNRPGEAEAGPG